MKRKHLLIVDDDERILTLLERFLSDKNYRVSTAANSKEARKLIEMIVFDLAVVDVMMPGEDGLSLTKYLSQTQVAPVLVLSARVETRERIIGLESGADDYLPKPFEPRELLLRVEAILKRSAIKSEKISAQKICIGQLTYDTSRWELWKGDKRIHLTPAEIKLLHLLSTRLNSVVSRDDLIRSISVKPTNSEESQNKLRTIDVQIKRLRAKLETDPKLPRYLKTIRGQGYILQPD